MSHTLPILLSCLISASRPPYVLLVPTRGRSSVEKPYVAARDMRESPCLVPSAVPCGMPVSCMPAAAAMSAHFVGSDRNEV